LDPLLQFESGFASQGNEKDYNLDIFEITMSISELAKSLSIKIVDIIHMISNGCKGMSFTMSFILVGET
jgi:hypothetical protein